MRIEQRFERMAVPDFPSHLHDEVKDYLADRTVGMTALVRDGNREVSTQIGSGTLIWLGGRRAILTADHVVDRLLEAPRMGVLSDFTGRLRRISFDLDHIDLLRLGNPGYGPDGPDLAVMFLPPCDDLDRLINNKIFHNLDRRLATTYAIAVGMRLAAHPPHRSRRAQLTHRAPTSGD